VTVSSRTAGRLRAVVRVDTVFSPGRRGAVRDAAEWKILDRVVNS